VLTIGTRAGAGVTVNGTTRGGLSLGRGVVDIVIGSGAPTLEGVV
jgi:hypothetical protein